MDLIQAVLSSNLTPDVKLELIGVVNSVASLNTQADQLATVLGAAVSTYGFEGVMTVPTNLILPLPAPLLMEVNGDDMRVSKS